MSSSFLVHFALLSFWLGAVWLLTLSCSPQFMDQFEEEIPLLRAQMEQLQFQIWEPREIVFADVLLRRSKYVVLVQLRLALAALQP